MRSRLFLGLLSLAVFFALIALRYHIQVLLDVAYTYSSFYTLLHQHNELLYKYPASMPKTGQVPKIIHQVALGKTNITKYQDRINGCQKLHPTWEMNIWTDANATEFLEKNYPEILPHYIGYNQNIQRANILRYCVLHKYGGVYFDLDMSCLMPIDQTPLMDLPFASPGARPAGISNAFLVTKPGHAFLSRLLQSVASRDLYWGLPMRLPYVENMLSTGCMFFSNTWMRYVDGLMSGKETDRVYILADSDGNIDPFMWRGKIQSPIISHSGDSSWHSWDAGAILVIGRHLRLLAVGIVLGTVLGTVLMFRACVKKRRGYTNDMEGGILHLKN